MLVKGENADEDRESAAIDGRELRSGFFERLPSSLLQRGRLGPRFSVARVHFGIQRGRHLSTTPHSSPSHLSPLPDLDTTSAGQTVTDDDIKGKLTRLSPRARGPTATSPWPPRTKSCNYPRRHWLGHHSLTHDCSHLYRRALKLSLDWAVHRYVWRGQAMYIRELFENNKHVTQPRQQKVWQYTW